MEVKDTGVFGTERPPTVRASASTEDIKDPDQAYTFLQSIGAEDGVPGEITIRAVRSKVDWRIIPIMFLCVRP